MKLIRAILLAAFACLAFLGTQADLDAHDAAMPTPHAVDTRSG
jgi:hypothetical protein